MGNILFWDRVSIYSWRYRDKSPLLAHDQHFEGPPKSFPQQLYHVAISSIQHVSQFLHCPQVSLPVSCVILVGVKETPVCNMFPRWLVILNISCAYWPFAYHLWRIIYPVPLLIKTISRVKYTELEVITPSVPRVQSSATFTSLRSNQSSSPGLLSSCQTNTVLSK